MADEIDEEAAAVREQLLIGRVPMRVFGLAVGLGARALYDYMAQGLPFRRINIAGTSCQQKRLHGSTAGQRGARPLKQWSPSRHALSAGLANWRKIAMHPQENTMASGLISPLREVIVAAKIATGFNLDELTVLAAQHDPYRFDTQAGHRDGKWFPDNFTALVPHGRIHLRKSMARRSTRAGLQGVPTKSVPARAYVTSRSSKTASATF